MLTPDQFIFGVDRALRVLSGQARSGRAYPAAPFADVDMSEQEKRHAAGLMRVNHVGEICAQALYDAQGQFAQTPEVKQQLAHSGQEEEDHLAWTAQRVKELGSHTSLLNPFWYAGAFACGVVAAKLGNAVSLGFVVETERQVEAHLNGHLEKLPVQDARSRAIVQQMRDDEIAHGAAAAKLGASEIPAPVSALMKVMAKVMTSTAYHI
jgi:ubiquinone biosynthesis monooxygenase Coq7